MKKMMVKKIIDANIVIFGSIFCTDKIMSGVDDLIYSVDCLFSFIIAILLIALGISYLYEGNWIGILWIIFAIILLCGLF